MSYNWAKPNKCCNLNVEVLVFHQARSKCFISHLSFIALNPEPASQGTFVLHPLASILTFQAYQILRIRTTHTTRKPECTKTTSESSYFKIMPDFVYNNSSTDQKNLLHKNHSRDSNLVTNCSTLLNLKVENLENVVLSKHTPIQNLNSQFSSYYNYTIESLTFSHTFQGSY